MKKYMSLSADKLRAALPPEKIPYDTSEGIARNGRHAVQQRALQALELGLLINSQGYNIYVSGEAELGRRYLLRNYLTPRARKGKTPPDFVYAHNFADTDAPVLLQLPAGLGRKLKKSLTKAFEQIQKEIGRRLDKKGFALKKSLLFDEFQISKNQILGEIDRVAGEQGFHLGGMDEGGSLTVYPLVDGKRLNEEEYERLDLKKRKELKAKSDALMQQLSGMLRDIPKMELDYQEKSRSLERELVDEVLQSIFDPLAAKFSAQCGSEKLDTFFRELRANTVSNTDALIPREPQINSQAGSQLPPHGGPGMEAAIDELGARYNINVFVDNAETNGAPLVFEDHPTLSNLMGAIERESEMGTLITDYTLIRAGAIHRANGGYLVMHIEDVLHHITAWEALLRALRAKISRIDDASDDESNKTKGLQPEPVPLSLKVILVGKEDIYENLLYADERFGKLFKIKAHLSEYTNRNSLGIRTYLSNIGNIIEADGLLPFDRFAMASLVDYGSRIIEDQQRLSLKFPRIREVMIEASAYAVLANRKIVDREMIRKSLQARDFRSNLVEEDFMEEYDRRIIKVVTRGAAVGRANGLAVSFYGNFEFGLPHQISCTIGAGSSGIIDLEREAQLSGPIHTKAMMILKSYLVGSFAHNKPLLLTGSLGFEQNYTGIEGDSASGAELAALLSALAGVPNRLCLAFTGSVSQSGQIMAVGGINRKIEGFFEVCRRHGLTGDQGVILPKDNCVHMMLNDEVTEAVRQGKFHIYPVEHINEAMEILTGMPCGRLGIKRTYTKGSLYDLIDKRLFALAATSLKHSAKSRF